MTKIEIDTENTKTEYVLGSELSVSLKVTYSNGSSDTVTTGYTSDYDKTKVGAQSVTITYEKQTVTLDVTVKDVKVTKVEKNAESAAISVEWGEELDLTGLKLDVTFDDGTSAAETSGFTVDGYDKTDATKVGEQTITVSYGTKATTEGASNSISLTITITNPVKSIEAALADGVTFTEGDTVSKDKLVVNLVKKNGDKEATTAYDFAPTAALATSDTKITVTPTGDYAALEAKEVAITVEALTFTNTYTIDLTKQTEKVTASPIGIGPWNTIPKSDDNKSSLTITGNETDEDIGYLAYGVKLFATAKANYNSTALKADGASSNNSKKGLFLTSTIVDGENPPVTADSVPVLIGAELNGKFRITVSFRATGGNDGERSDRKVALYRADDQSAIASITKTNYNAIAGQEGSKTTSKVSYTYNGNAASSVVGIALFNDMSKSSSKLTDIAAYITEIKVETDETIADDEYPATALTVYDKDGTTEIADNGTLTVSKADSGYTLSAAVTPTWTTDDVEWAVTTASSPITVPNGVITFEESAITADTNADITVTAGSVTKTVKLTVTASISVKNVGKRAGKEAVQLYVTAPDGGLVKPACELRAFGKTGTLAPGASETLVFTVDLYTLASFNEEASAWETAAGKYTAHFGSSSADIRATAQFKVAKAQSWPVHPVCLPQNPVEEIKVK